MDVNVDDVVISHLIPLILHPFQVIFRSVALIIGVPLNTFVAWVLIKNRRLHYARHFIWFGIVISNLLYLAQIAAEFVVSFWASDVTCRFIVVVTGKPYTILLINVLLASCDRIVHIKWPLFHEKHVTVSRIIFVQAASSSMAFYLLSVHFWALNEPIRCELEPWILNLDFALILILTVLCIVATSVVYFMLQEPRQDVTHIVVVSLPDQHLLACLQTPLRHQSGNIRPTERRASMTLVLNIIPHTMFIVLLYLYLLCQLLCHTFFDSCYTLNSLEVYCGELLLLHVSTDLLAYLFHSREFWNAARNMFYGPRRLDSINSPFSEYS